MPRTVSPETRARIAEARRGKRHSPETLEKMRQSALRRWARHREEKARAEQ